MSIRSSISYVQNDSGVFHLYSEAGGGDVCVEVRVKDKSLTHYGDMYLTIKELEEIYADIGRTLEWYHKVNDNDEAKFMHIILSHKYDDEVEPDKEDIDQCTSDLGELK